MRIRFCSGHARLYILTYLHYIEGTIPSTHNWEFVACVSRAFWHAANLLSSLYFTFFIHQSDIGICNNRFDGFPMYLPVLNSNNYIINATTGFRFHLMRHCGNRTLYCVILSNDENMRQILSGGLVGQKNKNQSSLLSIDRSLFSLTVWPLVNMMKKITNVLWRK